MPTFRLRRDTGGSALRSTNNDSLRAIDLITYTVTMVVTSTFNPALSSLSLISTLINNLLNSQFLISSSKNLSQSTVLSSLILTQSFRFLTLSILNTFSASISRLNSVSKDLSSTLTAVFLKQAQISLQTASNAVTLTLQKALSINRSFANTFNPTLVLLPLKGVNVGMTFSISVSKLLEVSRGASSVLSIVFAKLSTKLLVASSTFSSNVMLTRLWTLLLEASSLFNLQLFTQYTRFVSLEIISTFSVSFQRISSFLLTIPDVLDGGNQGSSGGLLDGGDESSSYDSTYDSSNQDLEYFITGTQKNVQRSFSISSTFLSLIDTLLIPGMGAFEQALEVLETFGASFSRLVTTSRNLESSLDGSFLRLTSRAFAVSSSLTATFVQSSFKNIVSTVESSINLFKSTARTLSATLDTSLEIARIAAYWLSLAVINTFSSLFNINVGKFVSLSSSNSVSFQKSISTSIELALSTVINLFTQSLRFISLAVLSTFSVVRSLIATSSLALTETLDNSIQKVVAATRSLSSTATSLIQSAVSKTITSTLTSAINTVRLPNINLNPDFSTTFAIGKEVGKTISNGFTALTSITTFVAHWVSLATINTFGVSLTKLPYKFINASFEGQLSFQKSLAKLVELSAYSTLSLLTQTARFVSLSIVSAFSLFNNISVDKATNVAGTLNSAFQRQISRTSALTASFTTAINRITTKSLLSSWTAQLDIDNVIAKTMSINLNSSLTFVRQLSKFLNTSVNTALQILRFVAYWLSLAIVDTFSSSLTKLPNKLIVTSAENTVSYQRLITQAFNVTALQTVNLLTQSLRFVSLNILSSYTVARNFAIDKTVSFSSSLTAAYQSSITRLFTISEDLTTQFTRSVAKSFNLTEIASLNFSRLTSSNINVTVDVSTTFVRQVAKNLALSLNTTVDVLRVVAYWLSMAVVDAFDTSITRLPNKFASINSSNTVNYVKQIYKIAALTSSNVINLLTQTLRFVSLSIISEFSLIRSSLVGKANDVTSSLTAAFQRQISTNNALDTTLTSVIRKTVANSISIVLTTQLNISNLIAKAIDLSLESSLVFVRQVVKSIVSNVSLSSEIMRIVAYWISMAVVDTFETLLVKLPNKFFAISSDLSPNLTRQIFKAISTTTNSVITLLTQTLRFVSLSLLSSFGLTKTVNVDTTTSVTEELISAFQRQSSRALTLSQVLTTAVNKNVTNSMLSSWTAQLNVGKLISNNLALDLDSSLVFVRQLAKSISLNVNLTVDMLRFVAYWLSLAIVDTFDSALVRLPNKLLNRPLSNDISFQRSISKSITLASSQLITLLTQTLRFLSLSIVSSFTASRSVVVYKFVQAIEGFNVAFQNQLARLVSLTASFDTTVNKNIFKAFASTWTASINLSQLVSKLVDATLEGGINFVRQTAKSISINSEYTIDMLRFVAYWLSMALVNSFAASFEKMPYKIFSLQSTASLTTKKEVDFKINHNMFQSLIMFLQPTLYLTSSMINEFAVSTRLNINKLVDVNEILSANLSRSVNKSLGAAVEFTININKLLTQNLTTAVENTLAASRAISRSLSLSTTLDSVIQKAISSLLSLTTETLTNIARFVAYWFSMAIVNNFDPAQQNKAGKSIAADLSTELSFTRAITQAFNLTVTASSLVLTQTLRFISLSIVDNFNTSVAPIISKLIALNNELTSTFSSQVRKTINLSLDNSASLIKSVTSTLSASITGVATFSKSIGFSLSRTVSFELDTAKFMTRTLSSTVTLSAEMARFVAYWLSMAITNIFDAAIVKRTNKLVTASVSSEINFQRSITNALNLLLTASVNIFTQTLRFISLAILNNFDTALTPVINKFVNTSVEFGAQTRNQVNTSIALTLTGGTGFAKNIFKAFNLSSSNLIAFSNLIAVNIDKALTLDSSVIKHVSKTLAASLSLPVDIARFVAHWLSLAIIDVFDSSIVKLPNKLISADPINTVVYQKSINAFINQVLIASTNIFTQTLRFVSLAIVSGFEVTRSVLIQFAVQLSQTFSSNFNRVINTLIAINSIFATQLNRGFFKLVSAVLEPSFSVTKQIGSFMVSSWNSQASISRQSSTRLETSFSGSTNFARYMAYLVTTGISLTFNIQTFVNKTISSVNTYSVQYQNNIVKFVSGALTTTTNIATQSFRYVSLAITSSFSPILNRLTSFLIATSFSSSLILSRANAKLLALDLSVSVNIQRLTSIIVSLRLQSLFDAIVQKTLLRTIAYTFEKYIFDNTMQGGSSETSTFEEIVDGSAGSGIVEGNPRLIAVLARTIGKEQIITLNIAVNLLKVISMNVRFAIVNLFETSLVKSVQHTVLASIDLSTNFQRSINVVMSHVFSLTTSLLTQSLRFISLSILDQFQTNFVITVSKGINNGFTLTAEWIKNTLKNLTTLSENIVVLVRLPNKLLTLGSEFITSFTSIILKYLQNVSTFVTQLSTQSLRFITLAVINSFASERRVLASSFYNVDTEVAASNLNTVGKLMASSTSSEINLSRIVAISILTTMTTAVEFARFIAISINFVLTASTLLGTQSLRFISLAIVNIFEVARTNLIGITRATTVEIVVNLRFTKNFMKLLEAATTLATRRSHTLYGTLTTFAVDKSQPGSEGSPQEMQRKTGGTARKRNIKNDGSTFFRRGETDDLD